MSSTRNLNLNKTLFNSSFVPRPQTLPWIINISETYRISFTICYALILVLSVLGNSSVIAVVVRNPSMRTTINYLIANMAATDLVAAVVVTARFFSISHSLSTAFQVSGVVGNIFCKLGPYIRDVSISVSIHSMVAIAFDRFFAVVYPLRATPRLLDLRILLPSMWLISLGFFSLHLINLRLVSTRGFDVCVAVFSGAFVILYAILVVVFYLIPFIIITVLYSFIARKLKRRRMPGELLIAAEEKRRKQNKKITKMAFAIVFCFWVCWTPYHLREIASLVFPDTLRRSLTRYFQLTSDIFILISYISFIINPYICFSFSSNFRRGFKKIFQFFIVANTRVAPVDGTHKK